MTDLTKLAKLRAELSRPAIGSSAHLRKIALSLVEELEKAQRHIAELDREQRALRTVGVMSVKAFLRLENRESRFIALWPRPEIYLPRRRPEDSVIVYARMAVSAGNEAEAE
ncbi:hypothetical protein [Raoultella planticola]|uniref:hypothetical protein n=1 Tax=Raoultella planticola TaxID=575 RepID=UPI00374B8996